MKKSEEKTILLNDTQYCINNDIEVVRNPFDLSNLRYKKASYIKNQNKTIRLYKDNIENFLKEVNSLSFDDRLLVIGIGTGGTISMLPTGPNGTLEPNLNFDSIIEKTDSKLKDEFQIVSLDAFSTDSSQLEIDDVGDLAISMCYLWKNLDDNFKKKFAGFFIVHGTDTISKSSTHLAMMLGKYRPFNIVYTGAQKTIDEKINDAQRNIKEGLYTLKMLYNNGCAECVTVMGGHALLSIGAIKISDCNARAIDSPMHKHIIDFNQLPNPDIHKLPNWLRIKGEKEKKFMPIIYRGPNRVQKIHAEMQEDIRAILALIRFGCRKGIILVTYGSNTFDINTLKIIKEEAEKQNIILCTVSSVNSDPNHINIYAVNKEMADIGIIPLYITRVAAISKIMLASALYGNDINEMKKFMLTDYIGEIPNNYSAKNTIN